METKEFRELVQAVENEDDEPQEASSKKECEHYRSLPEVPMKKMKKQAKRKRVTVTEKVNDGEYLSKIEDTTFRVVALSKSPPPPDYNFRAELLQKRTEPQRMKKSEHVGFEHRQKLNAVRTRASMNR